MPNYSQEASLFSRALTAPKKSKHKLHFPSWKAIMTELVGRGSMLYPHHFASRPADSHRIQEELGGLRHILLSRNLELLFAHTPRYESIYLNEQNLQDVLSRFKSMPVRPNEFYAVFDLHACIYREMDNKLDQLLGLKPDDFNVPALMQKDSFTHIFHPRDHYHMLRWACLAQAMVASRIFQWKSLEDQFRIRFRVRTQKSTQAAYRAHEFITLEKLCFLFNEDSGAGCMPSLHIDKWLIYDRSEFDQVRPTWISSIERQTYLNAVLYLYNASLIGFPVQYLVYLHERGIADRNKAIASRLSEQVLRYAGIDTTFEEQPIADCFAKTIRPRMEQTVNEWEFRKSGDLCILESDAQAVQAARALGLLPIPETVLKAIYTGITEL